MCGSRLIVHIDSEYCNCRPTICIMATRRVLLGPTGETVRANIARIRDEQRLTLRQLADRMSTGDRPLAHNTLSEIERGARRCDVDDLVAIAVALDVSPTALLRPASRDDAMVSGTGTGSLSARDYSAFLDGYRSPTRPGDLGFALRSLPRVSPFMRAGAQLDASDTAELAIEVRTRTDGVHVDREWRLGVAGEMGPFGSDDGDD